LRVELHGLVASPRQFLESSRDCRPERLPKVAGLGGIGLLHLIEQELPSLVLYLDFPFLPRRQIESLGGIAQPLAGNRASNLFESAMRPQDLALDSVKLYPDSGNSVSGGAHLFVADHAIGNRQAS
jgi:hypothetical protein